MGINISIVAPFKPIPVELAETQPLTACAITRPKHLNRQEQAIWHNRVTEAKDANQRSALGSSAAFPRYIEHRKVLKQNNHQGGALILAKPQAYDRMKVFHDRKYSADIRTSEREFTTFEISLSFV